VIFLQREKPHDAQVLLKTVSTEFDERIENRPKKKVGSVSKSVGELSLVKSDLHDESDIEGYGIVQEIDIIDVSVA
jgi:hypothetical protein